MIRRSTYVGKKSFFLRRLVQKTHRGGKVMESMESNSGSGSNSGWEKRLGTSREGVKDWIKEYSGEQECLY